MSESPKTRRFWGWGHQEVHAPADALAMARAGLPALLGIDELQRRRPPELDELKLPQPRVTIPPGCEAWVTADPFERANHSYGKSYRDLVRAIAGEFNHPPDLVAIPQNEVQIEQLLEHCAKDRIAVIPYGGGSSVCGGVEPLVSDRYRGTISLDCRALCRVTEVDDVSQSARIQAGVLGPDLERQLRPHGLSLRFYPQSFEFSTLGGWIATRAGGHFATLYTHIDDLVESIRLVSPSGIIETRRLPGSGAGPAPDRLFLGSEGALGIITEAWMRLTARPRFRISTSAEFDTFGAGLAALRALSQSRLHPQNARLLDPLEAQLNGVGGGKAVLVLGFESAHHPMDAWMELAIACCRDHGGMVDKAKVRSRDDNHLSRDQSEQSWRDAFVRAPYLRDELVLMGIFVETYETATTWDKLESLVDAVRLAADRVGRLHRPNAAPNAALVSCRITHAYPNGAAPYFTVIAPAQADRPLEQWADYKTAITDAIGEAGGTCTHHHAIGRDTRPFLAKEAPALFTASLQATKSLLDPSRILNPGSLLAELDSPVAQPRGRMIDPVKLVRK